MAVTIVQSATGTTLGAGISVTLPATPTPGNVMVTTLSAAYGGASGDSGFWTPAVGFTLLGDVQIIPGISGKAIAMAYRVVQLGDDGTVSWSGFGGSSRPRVFIVEIVGTLEPASVVELDEQSAATSLSTGSVAISGAGIILGAFATANASATGTPGTGITELLDDAGNGGFAPRQWVGYGTAAGSGSVATTMSASAAWCSIGVAITGPPSPPSIDFDVYTPEGIHLVTFDNLIEKRIRVELNRPGEGSFRIARSDAQATATNLARGNIVRVTFTEIDADPIFEFIIETGDFALLSPDEEGGEILSFGGRGTLAILEGCLLGYEALLFDGNVFPDEGVWRWTLDASGAILRRVVLEAQERSPDPTLGMTLTWSDDDHDSDGNLWTIFNEGWESPIGADVLTEAYKLIDAGQINVRMTPGLVINVYRDIGRDLTGAFGAGSVRFEKGVNIASDLSRQMAGQEWASDVLVKTSNAYAWVNNPGAPYRREAFLDNSNITGSDAATAAAEQQFTYRDYAQDGITLAVAPYSNTEGPNDEAAGFYYPGPPDSDNGKYWPGDLVTLHTGTGEFDFDAETQRIQAITLYEDEAGQMAPPIVELNAPIRPRGETQHLTTPGVSSTSGSTSGGGSGAPTIHKHDHGTLTGLSGDDHPQYQKESEKGAASGYASLDGSTKLPLTQLPAHASTHLSAGADAIKLDDLATPDDNTDLDATTSQHGLFPKLPGGTTNFWREDGSWAAPSGGAGAVATDTIWDAKGDLAVGTAADTAARVAVGTDGYGLVARSSATPGIAWEARTAAIEVVIDGGGSAITAGVKGDLEIPFACTITANRLLADQSGSIVIDIWKDTYANFPPTVADTITASAKPTLSAAAKSQDTTLTGWTVSLSAGDVLRFNVDSASTVTRVTLSLTVRKT